MTLELEEGKGFVSGVIHGWRYWGRGFILHGICTEKNNTDLVRGSIVNSTLVLFWS